MTATIVKAGARKPLKGPVRTAPDDVADTLASGRRRGCDLGDRRTLGAHAGNGDAQRE
jgi:hypothetical protein